MGLKAGVNTYAYVRSNPVRLIDPRGLSAYSDFADCLAERTAGDYMKDCNLQLFASATAEAVEGLKSNLKAACEMTLKGLVCTATCAVDEIIGKGIVDMAINAHQEAAMRALEHIAETTANQFVKRGVPVLNVILTARDVYFTAKCTVNCVKQ